MKVIAVSIMALLLMLGTVAPLFADDVSVKGYFRNDGTYVQPHMRSAPDSSYNNNWSTSPNINPYTGQGLGFLIGGFTGAVVGLVVRGIFA